MCLGVTGKNVCERAKMAEDADHSENPDHLDDWVDSNL